VSACAWAAVLAFVGLTAVGSLPALAVHVSTDVLRPPEAFRSGHLPRARSLPLDEVRRREAEIPRTGRVVLYASTPEEAAAAYQALREAGHRNVMVLAGGLPAWIRLGYPVETSR
jgi:rhodanese-related sulfurtransferase